MNSKIAAGAFALTIPSIFCQVPSEAPTQFEVASVKQSKVDPVNRHSRVNCFDGGRFVASDVTAQFVIEWAYDIRSQLSVPGWASSFNQAGDTYDIEAKAAGPVTLAECRVMAQRLLEDRFHLKLHRESKNTPVYELVPAKNGPRLREVNTDTSPESTGVRLRGHKLGGKGWESWKIAAYLQDLPAVGRPVVDRTGLTGIYEFSLDFSNGPGARPEIFDALEEQLGLKLEPAKASIEVVLVDRLEKPSAN
jgi:uncharacterized protein (TIGR03435 family)